MDRRDPPAEERRAGERRAPQYTAEQISELRIIRAHFRNDYLFCLLSDHKVLCVPLTISPELVAASAQLRYQWQVASDGKAIAWFTKGMGVPNAVITLANLLAHPESQVSDFRTG
jgi:hypothetical protein